MEIADHFNIREANLMSKNEFYTAFSRGVSLDKVHVDKLKKGIYFRDREEHVKHSVKKADLKFGQIYKITFSNGYKYIGRTDNYLSRYEEHKLHPTNEAMAEAFEKCESKIELLEEFFYASDSKIAEIEKMWIERESDLLNVCHNVAKIDKPKKEVQMKKSKFNITEDAKEKRYLITYTVEGKKVVERFSYAKCSKEDAMKNAVEKQKELRSR